MAEINQFVTVVIRSAGERTEDVCKNLILKEGICEDNITIVREKPFSAAVRKTFELGIAANRSWTLAVDADILLSTNAIQNLVHWAEGQEEYFFEFQGRVVDKFFCAPRPGGPHLYRTKYLKRALDFIPKDKNALRPESYTYHKMAEIGFHYYHHPEIYGIHDYFQYYKDIYRKAFLQAHKHSQHIEYFVKQWAKYKEADDDYKVALTGLIDGLSFRNDVEVDVDFFKEHMHKSFNKNKVAEKKELDSNMLSQVEEIIALWGQDADAVTFEKANLNLYRRSDAIYEIGKNSNQQITGKLLQRLGNLLCKMGNYTKKLANS